MNIFKSKISESEQSLITLQESFDKLNEQFDTITNELKEANELANTYKEEFERVNQENISLKEQLEATKQENAEVTQELVSVDELASIKAVEVLAECGHAQVDIIDSEEALEEVKFDIEAFKKLKGKELQEFYNNNKQAIMDAYKNNH